MQVLRMSIVVVLLGAWWPAPAPAESDEQVQSGWDEARMGPLPRWRAGGTPPTDPDQPLQPYAVKFGATTDVPTSGVIASPPEYSPTAGVLFRYSSNAWPTVVRDLVVALTQDPAHDEIAYVVVSSASQQQSAYNMFIAGGADMSKVEFLMEPTDSIWLRDYGPHFVWQNNALAIVDSHYYPTRPLDNFIPTLVADDHFLMPSYDIGLYYSGGNFQPGPDRSGFITSLVYQDNPGFSYDFLSELYHDYQGVDTLHVFPRLPGWVDGTGHIDMWMYLIDDDTVIISQFEPGSDPDAIAITNNAVTYMEGHLGFEVFRTPALNIGSVHYTYTNAFRVNNRIFTCSYGQGNASFLPLDAEANAAFQAAAPECEIIPINAYSIIPAAGAFHCIVMQVPRYTDAAPAAHVVSPDGGELLVGGTSFEVAWAATDDEVVTSVDIRCSLDGGGTFDEVIALDEPDDGFVAWTLPDVVSGDARVKVVAHDADGQSAEAVSETGFTIAHAHRHVYDFSTGAGVDKWGWGYQTLNWSLLDGVRHPPEAATEISLIEDGAYDKIAHADATGGDYDGNRYRSPIPSGGRESTHIFDFTIDEDPARMLDVEVLWEGYGDACVQMELYVWDFDAQQWSNGAGLFNENRFVDNQAANRDAVLVGHIRGDFGHYIGEAGEMTILLYGERPGQESFHDYIAVTVTHAVAGDVDVDGDIDAADYAAFHGCFVGPGAGVPAGCDPADADGDGDVDLADFAALQTAFTGS